MDACTIAALDAVTAFAVPNPGCSSQSRRFFGSGCPAGCLAELIVGSQATDRWEMTILEPNAFERSYTRRNRAA